MPCSGPTCHAVIMGEQELSPVKFEIILHFVLQRLLDHAEHQGAEANVQDHEENQHHSPPSTATTAQARRYVFCHGDSSPKIKSIPAFTKWFTLVRGTFASTACCKISQ